MPTECYRFVIQGISTGEQCQNVLHFNCNNNDDAPPIAVAKELVEKWHASFRTDWLDWQSNRYWVRWVEAKRILPGGGNSYWREYPEGSNIGGVDEDQGVLQCAPIMKLFAGLATNVQGRVFLPAPWQTAVTANVIGNTYATNAIAHFEDLLSFSGSDHDFVLAVYSKRLGSGHGVTTCAISNILGSQGRRRQPL